MKYVASFFLNDIFPGIPATEPETGAKRSFLLRLATLACGPLLPVVVGAATVNVPGDQPTIIAGIGAAFDGDEVVVAPGVYNEVLDLSGKAITIRSSHGADVTVIDAAGLDDSVIIMISGEGLDTVVSGFTLTGGIGTLVGSLRLGGAIYARASSPTIKDCILIGNRAYNGGGMANYDNANPTVSRCWIAGNDAVQGGGVFNFNSSPEVENCLFTGNRATTISGGMDNSGVSNPSVINCTFSRNSTDGPGGGMTTGSGANAALLVVNCIFWQNQDSGGTDESAQIHVGAGLPTVRYSCIEGLIAGGIFDSGSNTNNIGDDPQLVDDDGADNIPGTLDDDLHLLPGSPCIDTGDNSAVDVPTDLDGNPRISGGIVDMGCYETPAAVTLIRGDVDASGEVNFGDGFLILKYLFFPGHVFEPTCLTALDVDDNGGIGLADSIHVFRSLLMSGHSIPQPFPDCGVDPTPDDLTCESFEACP